MYNAITNTSHRRIKMAMSRSAEKSCAVDDQSLQKQPRVELVIASEVNIHPLKVGRSIDQLASGRENESCGYECEFVQHPPEALQTDCSICLMVLRKPHIISCCGQSFCLTCIDRIKTEGKSCPLCSAPGFSIIHNRGLQNTLKDFEVRCAYATSGCEWVGKLGHLDDHLNLNPDFGKQLEGCDFVEIPCNHKCGGVFSRHMLANHQGEECPKRPYSCGYCREYVSTFENVVNNHWPVCKCYPISCPNQCTPYAIERQHFSNHLSKDCPLTVVNCDFHHAGCKVQLPRKDMPAHLRENFTHVSLLAAMNQKLAEKLLKKDEEISKLSQELKEMMVKFDKKDKEHQQQLEREISQLKSELTRKHDESVHELRTTLRQEIDRNREEKATMKQEFQLEIDQLRKKQATDTKSLAQDMINTREKQDQDRKEIDTTLQRINANVGLIPFQITMSDFETHKAVAGQWFSEPFYTHPGGYKLCLCVYANGYHTAKKTHVSVFAHLMRGMFDEYLKWPLLCDITVELLNQKENEGHCTGVIAFGDSKNAFRVTKQERAAGGWGVATFISHAELYSRRDDFINDGSIRFQITKIVHRKSK